jgi:hypothetical protein
MGRVSQLGPVGPPVRLDMYPVHTIMTFPMYRKTIAPGVVVHDIPHNETERKSEYGCNNPGNNAKHCLVTGRTHSDDDDNHCQDSSLSDEKVLSLILISKYRNRK